MSDSFYNTLEVPETASIDEIKKSYRRMSMLYHPDKNKNNPDATSKFQKMSEAYETLGDPDKKKEYDMRNKNPFFKMMNMHGQGQEQGVNPVEEMFTSMFGMPFGVPFGNMHAFGQQGFGQGQNIRIFHNGIPVNMQGVNVNGVNVNGVNVNGVNMHSFTQGLQKPTPIIKTINVPIDKILSGTVIPVDVERWLMQENNKIFEMETIYVTVPKGMDDGEIIILRDKGNVLREDCKGDIKLFIKIINETDFKRSGLDLILEKTITVKEALCGFNFDIKYITGKTYTITNNSGNIVSHGYRKTIPNMGFTRDDHTGNLIIMFTVKFPEKIADDMIEQLKKIDF
jgi:DnaJ-class molecular chaperone